MSKVLIRIKSLYPGLTNSDKRIAEVIENNFEQIPFLTIHQMAEKIDSSATTVSRFVKKLGYASYRDFKYEMVKENVPNGLQEIYEPISGNDTEEEIVTKVFSSYIEGMRNTLDITDAGVLKIVAEHILGARKLVFMGIGGSGTISKLAAQRFLHLGIHCDALTDEYDILVQSLRMNHEDVVVGISHSGRTKTTLNGLKYAKEKKAFTVGISNYDTAQMRKICDYQLLTAFRESRVRAAAISSFFLQVCLVEAIYLLVARQKKELDMVSEMNSRIEKDLRFK